METTTPPPDRAQRRELVERPPLPLDAAIPILEDQVVDIGQCVVEGLRCVHA
jgi:hypothetical protein